MPRLARGARTREEQDSGVCVRDKAFSILDHCFAHEPQARALRSGSGGVEKSALLTITFLSTLAIELCQHTLSPVHPPLSSDGPETRLPYKAARAPNSTPEGAATAGGGGGTQSTRIALKAENANDALVAGSTWFKRVCEASQLGTIKYSPLMPPQTALSCD